MSDQNPWGAPPPSYGTGGGYGPPQGQGPGAPQGGGYGPPPGGPGGYGQPPGGYGPPPQKKRTGLIIGLVVAAVVLIVGGLSAVLVATSGDGDSEGDRAEDSSSSTEPTSDSPTETDSPRESSGIQSGGPTETSTLPPLSDSEGVNGDGYQYEFPGPEWTDVSEEGASRFGGFIDTMIVFGPSIELAQSNIITEAVPVPDGTTKEDLRDVWFANIASDDGATPEEINGTSLDGEATIGAQILDRTNESGISLHQFAYMTVRGDRQYTINLTIPAEGDVVSRPDFETVLANWRWTR